MKSIKSRECGSGLARRLLTLIEKDYHEAVKQAEVTWATAMTRTQSNVALLRRPSEGPD